jgi:hypothetical protein
MTTVPDGVMLAIQSRPTFAVVRLILNNLQQKSQRRVAAEICPDGRQTLPRKRI